MAKIIRLSEDVIGQIAAGEVVERPAAAIKELVENSMDAGATSITVDIENGGLTLLRVIDNGSGIDPEDLLMAFERHATSKLRAAEELSRVETLGFRGEALSSIAAVSRVTLVTRQAGAPGGMRVENEGGTILQVGEAACAEGTAITVRDLFFNAPVRLKFMKKPSHESAQAAELMRLLILSHPDISFRFKVDGKPVYFSPGDGKVDSAVLSVYGLATLKQMKKTDGMMHGVLVDGLVGVGDMSRGNRMHQSFFVNGRAMRSMLLSQAVEEACRQRVMIGRYPMCVLYLKMPLQAVDVNVHPNKWEVRFSDESGVREAVLEAVRNALSEGAAAATPPPLFREALPTSGVPAYVVQEAPPPEVEETPPISHLMRVQDPAWAALKQTEIVAPPAREPSTPPEQIKSPILEDKRVRIIGTVFSTYILMETEDSLLVCDQHALHERLLFERLKKAYDTGSIGQMLLTPRAIHLSYREYGTFLEHQALLASTGFDAEDFGEQTIRLHSVPLVLGEPEAESSLRDALDVLAVGGTLNDDKRLSRLLQSACKHAVKGGENVPIEALRELVKDMLAMDIMPTCPHGRPLLLSLTKGELEKRFGRVQL